MTTSKEEFSEIIDAAINNAVSPLLQKIDKLQTFVDRRLSEVSTEVSLSMEAMEMNDDSLKEMLHGVRSEIGAVVTNQGGNTAHNSGLELEAVIKYTEEATMKILDSAERIINVVVEAAADPKAPKVLKTLAQKVQNEANSIIQETEFQDITGQRLREALKRLFVAADALDNIQVKLGGVIDQSNTIQEKQIETQLNQSSIDDMFNNLPFSGLL